MTRQKRHWLCVAVLSIAILFFFGRLIQAATDGVSVSVDVTAAPSPGGFSPPPPPPPPPTVIPNVINFQAVYNGQVSVINLSWRNPPPAAFPAGYQLQAIRIIRSVTGYPISPSGNITGLIVYDAAGQATSDGNVSLETTYYYTAFVRAVGPGGAIAYASGAVAVPPVYVPLVAPPPGPPPPPPGPPAPPPSPYDIFPQVTVTDGKTGALGLGDFEFLQPDEPIKFFRGGADITIKPAKSLTVRVAYGKLPAVLKTIIVTLFDPFDRTKSFSWLLRVNDDQTYYQGTIGPLPRPGVYPLYLSIINFQNQSIKTLNGRLVAVGELPFELPPVFALARRAVSPLAVATGLGVGLLQVVLVTTRLRSFYDLYLVLARLLGSLGGLIGLRRRSTPWGTVYDAVTKQPLDPAYVALINTLTGKETSSAITDLDGRYGFFIAPGNYQMQAGKTHYAFPSQRLAGKEHDELYPNLYFGEAFLTQSGEVITKNIPLDPIDFDWNEFIKNKKRYFRLYSRRQVYVARLFNLLFAIGFLTAWGTLLVSPGKLNLAIGLFYVTVSLGQYFWRARHPIVAITERLTGEPYSFAVVKLFLSGTTQLIKRVVADELGRFYLLVPPGEYYLTVDEKLPDAAYRTVYQSAVFRLKKGVLRRNIVIDAANLPTAPKPDGTPSPS